MQLRVRELNFWEWSCRGTCGESLAQAAWRRDLACRCKLGMRLLFALFSQICFALLGEKRIINAWENTARAKSPIRLEVPTPAFAMGLIKNHRFEAYVHNNEPEQLLNQLFPWQITLPLEAGGHKEKGNRSKDSGNNGLDSVLIWTPLAKAEELCSFLLSKDLWAFGRLGREVWRPEVVLWRENPGEGRIVWCGEAEKIVLMGLCPTEKHDLHIR